jgi:predicted SAM-dependent methyltransferase
LAVKRLLNAGAGTTAPKRILPLLTSPGWEQVRLDVDSGTNPDVVGSVTQVAQLFSPQSFDLIWCSHVMEHLYAHEIYPTFTQFRQILKPDGFALIMCPDLEAVAKLVVEHGLAHVAYESAAGPIRPLDMIYGHSSAIEQGKHHMAHRTGFTTERVGNLLLSAGFPTVSVTSENFEVCALALMERADGNRVLAELASLGFDFREQV